jgi:hypothetical protein
MQVNGRRGATKAFSGIETMTEDTHQNHSHRRRIHLKTEVKRAFLVITAMGVLCSLTAMVGQSSPPAPMALNVSSPEISETASTLAENQNFPSRETADPGTVASQIPDGLVQDPDKSKTDASANDLHEAFSQTSVETLEHAMGVENTLTETVEPVDDVLKDHFDGSEFVFEKRAFINVLRWKSLAEATAQDYDEVSSRLLLAIIKTETQGKTGLQISDAGAVGLTQIKFEGAWGFLWNALCRKKILVNGKEQPDYYNDLIRKQYHYQLERIRRHLVKQGILVEPKNYSKAQMAAACAESWKRFKAFLDRAFDPDEYQVAVDISAMYLNHLKLTFDNYREKTGDILQRVKSSQETDLEDLAFKGLQQSLWTRILSSETDDCGNGAGLMKRIVARLKRVRKRLGDPKSWIAAYLSGPTTVIRCIENGDPLPPSSVRYSTQVNQYLKIFKKMEAAAHSGAPIPQA